jgi:hypothetical protein
MAETNGRPLDYCIGVSRVGDRAGDEAYGSPEIQRQGIRQWAGAARCRAGLRVHRGGRDGGRA